MVSTVVIATDDRALISKLSGILLERNYSIVIEKSKTRSVLKILDQKIDLLILDLDDQKSSCLDLINIIKKTRPKLPIITISKDSSIETIRKIKEMGVFYNAIKPIQTKEIAQVIDATRFQHTKLAGQSYSERQNMRQQHSH